MVQKAYLEQILSNRSAFLLFFAELLAATVPLLFAMLVFCILPGIFISTALAIEPKHYEVEQTGAVTVHVEFDAHSLRAFFPKNQAVLVSSSPEWKICLFNRSSKRIYRMTESTFRDKWVFYPPTFSIPVMTPPLQIRSSMLFGVHVLQTRCGAHEEAEDPYDLMFASKASRRPLFYDEYRYTVGKCNSPIEVNHIMQDIFRLPVSDYFPLEFLEKKQGRIDDFHTRLKTESLVLKPGLVDTKEPGDYELRQDPNSVWLGASIRAGVENSIQNLFLDPRSRKQSTAHD